MPRADVTVTITGDVVRVRTRETAIEAVIRISAEQPSPQSQPTLYIIIKHKFSRGTVAFHAPPDYGSTLWHKAKPRAEGTVTTTGDVERGRTRETANEAVRRSAAEQPSPQLRS